MGRVRVSITDESHRVRYDRRRLMRLVRRILADRFSCVDIAVVGARRMAVLNRQFLRRSGTTDVLAFDLGHDPKGRGWGQIVVCDEVARRQARQRRIRAEDELALYVAHGALHLLGQRDDRPEQRERMRKGAARALCELGYCDVTCR